MAPDGFVLSGWRRRVGHGALFTMGWIALLSTILAGIDVGPGGFSHDGDNTGTLGGQIASGVVVLLVAAALLRPTSRTVTTICGLLIFLIPVHAFATMRCMCFEPSPVWYSVLHGQSVYFLIFAPLVLCPLMVILFARERLATPPPPKMTALPSSTD